MGVRISMQLLCGIADLKYDKYDIVDPRYKGEQNIFDNVIPIPEEPISIQDLLDNDSYSIAESRESQKRYDIRTFLLDSKGNPHDHLRYMQYNNEYGCGNVIGLVVSELPCAHHCLYALAEQYPEFKHSGYKLLNSSSLEEDDSRFATYLKCLIAVRGNLDKQFWFKYHYSNAHKRNAIPWHFMNVKKNRIKHGQNYLTYYEYLDSWFRVTDYIFKHLKLRVPRKDLRLILYWEWS